MAQPAQTPSYNAVEHYENPFSSPFIESDVDITNSPPTTTTTTTTTTTSITADAAPYSDTSNSNFVGGNIGSSYSNTPFSNTSNSSNSAVIDTLDEPVSETIVRS